VKGASARGSVKGSVIASRLAFVRDERGDPAVERVLAQLTDEQRAVLKGILLPFTWYPFELNEALDFAIAAEFGSGSDIFLRLGARSADDNLGSASQKQYIRDHNPQALLKNTSAIYGVYYDTGHRDYVKLSETSAVLRTFDSLSFSTADCLTVVGWYERALSMCGGKQVRVLQTKCRANGDEICEYECSWT
jgi:uncharacterized protein (TIGR02265 family)